LVKVNGTITLDGKPLPEAVITFVPEGGGGHQASGMSGSDGSFRLTTFSSGDGAERGSYKVTVTLGAPETDTGPAPDPTDPKAMAEAMRKYSEKNRGKAAKKSPLPASYSDPAKTSLKYVLPPPDGKVLLELKSTGS